MAVLSCPHCGTVHIVVGGQPDTDVCTQIHCRGIMTRLDGEQAGHAIRAAVYFHALDKIATVTADAP